MSQYLTGLNLLDPGVKKHNGGGTSFTMDDNGTTNGTLLWVDGVAQIPGTDYNVSGTTITTTSSTPSGTNNVVSLQLFSTGLINTPGDDTVATAKIQNDAVTLAKMAAGTDGNLISYDTSGNPVAVATGNDGQVLTSSGAGAVCAFETLSAGFTQGTEQATTSGTSFTFSSIPAGVDMIVINFAGVSQSSTGGYLITIGDSGGLETSGYVGTGSATGLGINTAVTSSFLLGRIGYNVAAQSYSGQAMLTLEDASNFTWCFSSWVIAHDTQNQPLTGHGSKSLSAELTQLQLSGGTFDAGAVNIMYQ